MYTLIIVFFVFLNILNVYSEVVSGFDFEDNKAPKYLTERNGVAELSVKVKYFLQLNNRLNYPKQDQKYL